MFVRTFVNLLNREVKGLGEFVFPPKPPLSLTQTHALPGPGMIALHDALMTCPD